MNNRYNTTKTPETENEPVIAQATILDRLNAVLDSVGFILLAGGIAMLIAIAAIFIFHEKLGIQMPWETPAIKQVYNNPAFNGTAQIGGGMNKEDVVYSAYECIEDGPARDAVEQYAANNPMPGKNKEDVIYAAYECMEDGPVRDALEEYVTQNPPAGMYQPVHPESVDHEPRGYN